MQKAFESVRTLVDEIADDEVFEDVLKSIETDPNGPQIDIRNDLVAHLADRVTVVSDYRTPFGFYSLWNPCHKKGVTFLRATPYPIAKPCLIGATSNRAGLFILVFKLMSHLFTFIFEYILIQVICHIVKVYVTFCND